MKDGLIAFFKVVLFLIALPLLIASALAFQTHVLDLPASKESWLMGGMVTYILMNLFLYNFQDLHTWGQSVTMKIFGWAGPLGEIMAFIVPLYTVIAIMIYVCLMLLGIAPQYEHAFLFAIGFTLTMQVVLSARQLFDADKSPLKAQYLFSFSLILSANILIMALLLTWVLSEFSFADYIRSFVAQVTHFYKWAYRILTMDF